MSDNPGRVNRFPGSYRRRHVASQVPWRGDRTAAPPIAHTSSARAAPEHGGCKTWRGAGEAQSPRARGSGRLGRRDGEAYRASLAAAGVDGSLKDRMRDLKGHVFDKTGYIGGVGTEYSTVFLPRALLYLSPYFPGHARCVVVTHISCSRTRQQQNQHHPGGTSVGITDCRVYANPLYGHVCITS